MILEVEFLVMTGLEVRLRRWVVGGRRSRNRVRVWSRLIMLAVSIRVIG